MMGDWANLRLSLGGKRTKGLIRLAVSLGILYLLFSQVDWQQASKIVSGVNVAFLIFPLSLLLLDRFWMAWKWRMLLSVLGPAPTLYDSVRVYFISSFQGLVIPLGGLGADLVRYVHLRSADVSSRDVAVSIVAERVVGLLAAATLAMISSAVFIGKVGVLGALGRVAVWVLLGGSAGLVLTAALLLNGGLQDKVYRTLSRFKFVSDSSWFGVVIESLKQYRSRQGVILINYFLSVVEQLFSVILFFVGAIILGIPVTFSDCLAVIPISYIIELIPVGYAGIGIREGSIAFLFGIIGVGHSDVIVLSSVLFGLLILSLTPGALWSLTGWRSGRRRKVSA